MSLDAPTFSLRALARTGEPAWTPGLSLHLVSSKNFSSVNPRPESIARHPGRARAGSSSRTPAESDEVGGALDDHAFAGISCGAPDGLDGDPFRTLAVQASSVPLAESKCLQRRKSTTYTQGADPHFGIPPAIGVDGLRELCVAVRDVTWMCRLISVLWRRGGRQGCCVSRTRRLGRGGAGR
jgi:hypothetical protein